jgi:hypothetical protein
MENVIEYLKVPKILDVFFGISPYTFLAYFVSPQKYLAVLFFFCSLLLMGLPSLYWWKKQN